MNVSITKELESEVERLVKSGRYGSASEVVREGLRMLLDRERRSALREQSLRTSARVGFEQLDRGEGALIPFGSLVGYIEKVVNAGMHTREGSQYQSVEPKVAESVAPYPKPPKKGKRG